MKDIFPLRAKTLPGSPGVYRMLDSAGNVLYVGKARNLKARVQNYARLGGHANRIARMISATASILLFGLGSVDAMKVRSSMTLFHRAAPDDQLLQLGPGALGDLDRVADTGVVLVHGEEAEDDDRDEIGRASCRERVSSPV